MMFSLKKKLLSDKEIENNGLHDLVQTDKLKEIEDELKEKQKKLDEINSEISFKEKQVTNLKEQKIKVNGGSMFVNGKSIQEVGFKKALKDAMSKQTNSEERLDELQKEMISNSTAENFKYDGDINEYIELQRFFNSKNAQEIKKQLDKIQELIKNKQNIVAKVEFAKNAKAFNSFLSKYRTMTSLKDALYSNQTSKKLLEYEKQKFILQKDVMKEEIAKKTINMIHEKLSTMLEEYGLKNDEDDEKNIKLIADYLDKEIEDTESKIKSLDDDKNKLKETIKDLEKEKARLGDNKSTEDK